MNFENQNTCELLIYAFGLSGPYRGKADENTLRLAAHTTLSVLRGLLTSHTLIFGPRDLASTTSANIVDSVFACAQDLPVAMEHDHAATDFSKDFLPFKKLSPEQRYERNAQLKNNHFFGIGDSLGFLLASLSADSFSPSLGSAEFSIIAADSIDSVLAGHHARERFIDQLQTRHTEKRRFNWRKDSLDGVFHYFGRSTKWAFWREWYQGFLDGNPMDWELQRRVTLIEDAIWAAGPEAVADWARSSGSGRITRLNKKSRS